VALPLAQIPIRDLTAFRGENAGRVFRAPRAVAFWHLASLDAPSVALVWALAFAWAGHIHLPGRVLLVLALATWCAYVGDRILDARVLDAQVPGARSFGESARSQELRERHYFHWRYRRLFVPLAVVAAGVAGAVALSFLSPLVRERGFVLAAAALVYFSGVHTAPRLERWRHSLSRVVSKEFLVAVLFTAGCILPAWSRFHAAGMIGAGMIGSRLWRFWIPGFYFAALAWLNCRCITGWEAEPTVLVAGARGRRIGTFKVFPALSTCFSAAVLLAVAGIVLACTAIAWLPRTAALLAAGALSALLLALLDRLRRRLSPLALRAGADLVLLTPLVLILR
jgi:hypothetical protein